MMIFQKDKVELETWATNITHDENTPPTKMGTIIAKPRQVYKQYKIESPTALNSVGLFLCFSISTKLWLSMRLYTVKSMIYMRESFLEQQLL